MRLPYNVTIQGAANGFVVNVGCETYVFSSLPSLLSDLEGYLQNPESKIREYQDKYPALLEGRHALPQLNPVQAVRNRIEGGFLPGNTAPVEAASYAQAADRALSSAAGEPAPERDF